MSRLPHILKLRQDPALIRPDFNGYKLSLEEVPVSKIQHNRLSMARSSTDDFSMLHVKELERYNHLHKDPWEEGASYFVEEMGTIFKAVYRPNTEFSQSLKNVYKLATINESLCAVYDGNRTLYVAETGNRYDGCEWIEKFRCMPFKDFQTGFDLRDARVDFIYEECIINCAFLRIGRLNGASTTKIYHILLRQDLKTRNWIYEAGNEYERTGSIYYCSFEPIAAALIVCSAKQELNSSKQATFLWVSNPTACKVDCQEHSIIVKKDQFLQTSLTKKDNVVRENMFKEAQLDLYYDSLMHKMEKDFVIDRINVKTQEITHRVFQSHAPLFSVCLRPGYPEALSTCVNNDACLWMQSICSVTGNACWNLLRHEGTLHGIGYIEDLQKNKQFITCSPNMEFTVICDKFGIYIYNAKHDTADNLRNRNAPTLSGTQKSIALIESVENSAILGVTCDNFIITILTPKFVYFFKIN